MIQQSDIENKLRELKPSLLATFGVDTIGYFGSFSRGEQTNDSDIDIIVSFNKPIGWAFFDLQELLEKEFGRRIDLVSSKALKEQLREIILSEVKYV